MFYFKFVVFFKDNSLVHISVVAESIASADNLVTLQHPTNDGWGLIDTNHPKPRFDY